MCRKFRSTDLVASVIVVACGIVLSSAIVAQTTTGTFSGTVQDESEAVVPGATVTVKNSETGLSRSTVSDGAGRYHISSLSPGIYSLTAEVTGFQAGVYTGIRLTVGEEVRINFRLRVGDVTQKVEVVGEAPLVDTKTSSVSGLVDETTVKELPLNGRSFEQLATLQTGVNICRACQGGAIVASGSRSHANTIVVDGLVQAVGSSSGNTPGSVAGTNLGVEAVREFRVSTNTHSAEFGRQAGAVMTVVTKSGTNELHGSVYEFHRNSALDARNFFDLNPANPTVRSDPPPFKRNQFGFSLGGPVVREKSFFFGNYEGLRESLGLSRVATVPDSLARQGFLPNPLNPDQRVQLRVHPDVGPFLALYPQPNGRSFPGGGLAEFLSSPNQPTREDYVLGKIDHSFSENDSMFFTYNFDQSRRTTPQTIPTFVNLARNRTQNFAFQNTKILSPQLLNVVNIGYRRAYVVTDGISTVDLDPRTSLIPGIPLGQINIGGGSATAGFVTGIGTGAFAPRYDALNLYSLNGQLNYVRGAHDVRTGVLLENYRDNNKQGSFIRGQLVFPSLERFLLGQPSQIQALDPKLSDQRSLRQLLVGAYVQDDISVTTRLTVNLGFRYETITAPSEAHGRASYWKSIEDAAFTVGKYFDLSHRTFEPRFGFAWDLRGDAKTAIRGGIGIYHNQPTPFFFGIQLASNPPFTGRISISNPPFPTTSIFSGEAPAVPASASTVGPRLDTPTEIHYNLSFQSQLAKTMSLTAAYVGSHGYHLTGAREVNARVYQILPDGRKSYPVGAPRRNPKFESVRFVETDSNSWYNALQFTLNRRLAQGLQLQAGYTFSKNIDEASGVFPPDSANGAGARLDPEDRTRDRSLAAMNVAHHFVFNCVYALPLGNGLTGIANDLLGGWQLGAILNLSSGEPLNAQLSFNGSRDGDTQAKDRPNLVPGFSNNPKIGSPDRWFDPGAFSLPDPGTYGNLGRNTMIGPGLATVDFSLNKDFAIKRVSEELRIQFRSEFFNILNRANFGIPARQVLGPTGQPIGNAGVITNTTTPSRQIQFGLRVIW